jgi:prepilin-type N-terminal cleavage/methylation domain-containing protein
LEGTCSNREVNSGTSRKARAGFTFVEAMVVAVIMSILAAVSIPIYSGYVTSQRQQVAKSMAQTAAVTANSIYRRSGAGHPTNTELNNALFLPNPAQFTITMDAANSNVNVVENSNPSTPVSATAKYKNATDPP